MKELFLLLLFIAGAAAVSEYHGDRRFWTIVDANGRTKVALHILNEPVNLVFPKDKTIAQLLSDMKLFSPSGNVQCQDTTNTMGFTLLFDDRNHIRGEIKMAHDVGGQKVKLYLYQKCGVTEIPDDYTTGMIEGAEFPLENPGRTCFKNGDPFRQYGTNTGDNVMELKVTPGAPGAFGCQAFLISPEYMRVEDGPLPKAQVNPLNSTFSEKGDAYWWKKETHEWLPSAVSFVGKNVKINVLNSSKATPIFLRIGNNSAIPAFKFAFSPSCNSFKTELCLNFKDESGCKIGIETTQAGFKVSTKGVPAKEIQDASKSPTLVFHETKNLVYVKVDDPLSVYAFDTCTMTRDVSDQLVVQIAPDEGGQCDSADVTINQRDIEKTIDVLIDRAKIVEPNVTIAANETQNTTKAAVVIAATTQKAADAGFQWWWVVAPLFGVLALIAAIVITYLCIRRRRKKQKPKGLPRVIDKEDRSISHDKEVQPKSPGVKTAIPPESPKKKKTNVKKKNDGKLDESNKGNKKSDKEKSRPSKSKPSEVEEFGRFVYVKDDEAPPEPIVQQPPKPCLFEAAETEQTQTETTVENGPRPELKNCSMYGEGGFEQMDKPFDYHLNEGSKHEPTIDFAAVKVSTPKLQQFNNFWSCIGSLSIPKRGSPIYVNSKVDGKHVYFMIRDCVAQQSKYAAFQTLANRMFEPFKFKSNGPEGNATSIDDENKYFVLRIFILSYEPLTMEVHCRGQVPLFLFHIFGCKKCSDIGKNLRKNAWLKDKSDSYSGWDALVCRVKRTPMNTHQFLSVNDPRKPKTADEVNHVLVIRGNKEPNELRKCIRRCDFCDWSHRNSFFFENDFQGGGGSTLQTRGSEKQMNDSTLQAEVTRLSSKELKG